MIKKKCGKGKLCAKGWSSVVVGLYLFCDVCVLIVGLRLLFVFV